MTIDEVMQKLFLVQGFEMNEFGMIRYGKCCPLVALASGPDVTLKNTDYEKAGKILGLSNSDAWSIACAADFACAGQDDKGKAHNELRAKLKAACRV